MAHLRVLDGRATIGSHTFANLFASALRVRLEVLGADVVERIEVLLQRRAGQFLGEPFFHPRTEDWVVN